MKKKVECPYCGTSIEYNFYSIEHDKYKDYGHFIFREELERNEREELKNSKSNDETLLCERKE